MVSLGIKVIRNCLQRNPYEKSMAFLVISFEVGRFTCSIYIITMFHNNNNCGRDIYWQLTVSPTILCAEPVF